MCASWVLFFVALPLPSEIKSRLSSLCTGISSTRWVEEESLHLTLRYLGPVKQDSLFWDIKERLSGIQFPSFSIALKDLGYFQSRSHGVIWVGVGEGLEFVLQLKKNIDAQLKGLALAPDERRYTPHVTLGRYEHLHSSKVINYLESHRGFLSVSFPLKAFVLISSQQTPKNHYYIEQESYPLA